MTPIVVAGEQRLIKGDKRRKVPKLNLKIPCLFLSSGHHVCQSVTFSLNNNIDSGTGLYGIKGS